MQNNKSKWQKPDFKPVNTFSTNEIVSNAVTAEIATVFDKKTFRLQEIKQRTFRTEDGSQERINYFTNVFDHWISLEGEGQLGDLMQIYIYKNEKGNVILGPTK